MFGISPRTAAPMPPLHDLEIPRAGITLITGPSGSGKSTLLRVIEAALRHQAPSAGPPIQAPASIRLESIPLPNRPLPDCFDLPLERTLGLLSRAGLAEARLWLRTPRELSEGERFRYRLARWMALSRRPILLADEFCNGLDRITARAVAWQLQRFVAAARRTPRLRAAIVATAHEDLAEDLRPALHVRMEALNH
jgi:ABC-type ATPase with predicted acetyltransferase domain